MKMKIICFIATAALAALNCWTDAPDPELTEIVENGGTAVWYTSTMTCQCCGRQERYEGNTFSSVLTFEDFQAIYPDWKIEGHELNCICLCPDCKNRK